MNQEITDLVKAYEMALNTSDATAALARYGSDPVFMAQNAEAFIGRRKCSEGGHHEKGLLGRCVQIDFR